MRDALYYSAVCVKSQCLIYHVHAFIQILWVVGLICVHYVWLTFEGCVAFQYWCLSYTWLCLPLRVCLCVCVCACMWSKALCTLSVYMLLVRLGRTGLDLTWLDVCLSVNTSLSLSRYRTVLSSAVHQLTLDVALVSMTECLYAPYTAVLSLVHDSHRRGKAYVERK
jgi:hypothetical protein